MNKIGFAILVSLMMVLMQPAVAQNATQTWNFRVYLDEKPIGYHRFELSQQGELRKLRSTARFDVKVLFINAYQYVHDADENWRGDCLQSLTASTDDNGKQLSVSAGVQGSEFNVSNRRHRYALSGCVMSFAYWNPVMLQQSRLLNAQTGEYDRVTIKAMGEESLRVHGTTQATQHYRLTSGKVSIDLWYSPAGDWVALESITDSGRRLRYVLS